MEMAVADSRVDMERSGLEIDGQVRRMAVLKRRTGSD